MSMATDSLRRDPIFREQAERARVAEKIERIARERRAGPSPLDTLEEAAAATLAQLDARRPSTPPPDDTDVSTDDLDPDLVDVADAHRRRLREAIDAPMIEEGYTDLLGRVSPELRNELLSRDDADPALKRKFGGRDRDVRRVLAELRKPAYEAPAKAADEPKPELTGEALIEAAAAEELDMLLADKPRGVRRL